jgi:hypothetical protein
MLALAGGGWRMGQVLGRPSSRGERPESAPVTPRNLLAAIMQTLFDKRRLRLSCNSSRIQTRSPKLVGKRCLPTVP